VSDTNSYNKTATSIKYPASWGVSMLVAAGSASVFSIALYLLAGYQSWFIPAIIAVFSIVFLFNFIVVEMMIIRRLTNLYTSNIQEIRQLKESEAFRREFIGDVSHELKTPIFAIEGFIETLLDGALEDPKVNRKFLQKALKNSERLSNLVQDILIINQIESGEMRMSLEKFRIHDLLLEVVESFEHKFIKRGRHIRYEIKANGNESSLVLADKDRIEQVLRNLIDNAIKYGDPNGLIRLVLESKGPEKLGVKVIDDGPGISEDHLPRLFERFYRVDKSRSRERGGTGLGLAICKHFIEAHREKIWAESEVGHGSVFQFTLSKTV
jgi:two-component system, OmpR family, phosphate regulon sensor histidine kinase PhoR